MKHRKKSLAGREERQELIARTFGSSAFARAKESIRGQYVAADDLADAFAAAWTAFRILDDTAERLPEAKQVDRKGVPMHIWA
jgi:predicted RNase H-like nuclease